MNLLKNFEITGQLSGMPISDLSIQQNDDLVLGLQLDIGLIILASDAYSDHQSDAQKAVEIMLDDMAFNLASQLKEGHLKQKFVSSCLHESIENINDFLIEKNQLNDDKHSLTGVSLTALQIHNNGISSCMHGDLSSYKFSNESFELIGSKTSLAKALGVNPSLSFSIEEHTLMVNDIIFLAHHSLIEQLGHEFIRITLSRFGDNLYMAIRQINARATKKQIPQALSFLLCRKINDETENKGWFK